MFLRIKRHLMAEADQGGSSGNPAAPAPAPAPENVPQAQGAPAITKEISDYIQSEMAKREAVMRDTVFAEARRTFTEKRNKPKDESPSPATTAPQQIDPHEERRVLRDFDRTVTRLGLHDKVSSAQWTRAEKALLAERPDDVTSWVKDYFEGFGSAAPQAPAPQAPTQPVTQPAPAAAAHCRIPVSDRGSPPVICRPSRSRRSSRCRPADRDALRKSEGRQVVHGQADLDQAVQVAVDGPQVSSFGQESPSWSRRRASIPSWRMKSPPPPSTI
jgi:hypothetical protein